jgi:hypothetical protein
MASGFEHDVLGEIKADEYFWIFPKKVAAYLVVGMGTAVILGKLFDWNIVGIILASIMGGITLVLAFCSVFKKSTKEYIKGGGISYLDIMERKVMHRKHRKIMSLCAELIDEKTKKGGNKG